MVLGPALSLLGRPSSSLFPEQQLKYRWETEGGKLGTPDILEAPGQSCVSCPPNGKSLLCPSGKSLEAQVGVGGWRAKDSRQLQGVTPLICWSAILLPVKDLGWGAAHRQMRCGRGGHAVGLLPIGQPSLASSPFLAGFPRACYIVSWRPGGQTSDGRKRVCVLFCGVGGNL